MFSKFLTIVTPLLSHSSCFNGVVTYKINCCDKEPEQLSLTSLGGSMSGILFNLLYEQSNSLSPWGSFMFFFSFWHLLTSNTSRSWFKS